MREYLGMRLMLDTLEIIAQVPGIMVALEEDMI